MPHRVTYDQQAGYILATAVGPFDVALAREILKDVVRLCKETGCKRILNDIREATFTMDLLDINSLPDLAREAGIDPDSRRALLVSDHHRDYEFFQNVSLLHRQKVRVFADLGEAQRWLAKAADTPPGEWRDGGPLRERRQ